MTHAKTNKPLKINVDEETAAAMKHAQSIVRVFGIDVFNECCRTGKPRMTLAWAFEAMTPLQKAKAMWRFGERRAALRLMRNHLWSTIWRHLG